MFEIILQWMMCVVLLLKLRLNICSLAMCVISCIELEVELDL